MALADIVLTDSQETPVDHTMVYIGTVGNRIIRSDLAAPPEEPLTFTIAHSASKIGGNNAQSHLARLDKTTLDQDGVTPHKSNIRLILDVENAILSDALVDDHRAMLLDWLSDEANFRAFARGSVG